MSTFPRGHHAFLARLHNAQLIARLNPDTSPPAHLSTRFEFPDPTDLRGIPAVGLGVPGHVRGTQPEATVCR